MRGALRNTCCEGVMGKQYLEQTDLSVEAIAAIIGYQDAANFRRAFRKRVGMTPGQYRSEGVT